MKSNLQQKSNLLKKILLATVFAFAIFILLPTAHASAATRTIANGGGNWSAIGTWVEGAVPIAGDLVVATATSGSLTVDVSTAAVGSFILTGFPGTSSLIVNNTLNVGGSVTLVSGMTITTSAGTPKLSLTIGGALTSNTTTWPYALTIGGVGFTLADNWTVSGLVTTTTNTGLAGNTLTCAGGITVNGGTTVGSTIIKLTGGTWSGAGAIRNPLQFAGNVLVSGSVFFNNNTMTYVSGTITTTGSTLTSTVASTFNVSGITWNNVIFGGTSATYTLTSNLNLSGNLTLSAVTAQIINGVGLNINVAGSISTTTAVVTSGTASVVMTGTGSISNFVGGAWRLNITINSPSGTITIGGSPGTATLSYVVGTFTYTTGTIVPGALFTNAATTFNTSGMTWASVTFAGTSITYTLTSDMNVTGAVTFSGSTTTIVNGVGKNLNVGGDVTVSGSTVVSGSATIVMNGTGILSTVAGGSIRSNLTFNSSSGTITISNAGVNYNTGVLTYTAGTMSLGSSTLFLAANTTLNTSGMTWNNISLSGTSITYTLQSDLNLSGTLTLSNVTAGAFSGAFNINISGSGNLTQTTSAITSGSTIVMSGTGTWSNSSTGALRNNLTLLGTPAISGTVIYQNGTLTVSGAIVPGSSVLSIGNNAALTVNTTGITFPTINTNTGNGSATFNGTNGFSVGTFTDTTVGGTLTWGHGTTYTITSTLTLAGTAASHIVFNSDLGGTRAIITLPNGGATQDVSFVNATDIDSSAGQTIQDYSGALSNTLNWLATGGTTSITLAFTFVL